jgi:hypothetical protein
MALSLPGRLAPLPNSTGKSSFQLLVFLAPPVALKWRTGDLRLYSNQNIQNVRNAKSDKPNKTSGLPERMLEV